MVEAAVPLVVHLIYRLDYGGLENGLVNLINNMPPDRYRHAIVCLTTYSKFAERIRRSDVPVIALNKQPGKDPGCYLRLARTLRSLRPAILHTRNFGTLDMQFVGALCRIPGRIHGEHGWDVYDLDGSNKRYLRVRRLARRLVHRYVAMSRDLARYLQNGVHVPEQRVHQIYSGVDTTRFRPVAPGESTPWPAGFAPADAVIIGTVGRLEPVKNPLGLVRAFARLVEAVPHARQRLRLVLIGAGPMQGEVAQAIAQAGIQSLVWMTGARDDVPLLMRHLDVFVLPSLNEGISNTILEAMASGVPVVAGIVGGNPEIVHDGETGRLYRVDDEQALADILAEYAMDDTLRTTHGDRARVLVEAQHSMESMVNAYLRVYDLTLNGRD